MSKYARESPTLQSVRDEVGWDPFDDEPTDFEVLERYIEVLEATVRAHDMLRGWQLPDATTGDST